MNKKGKISVIIITIIIIFAVSVIVLGLKKSCFGCGSDPGQNLVAMEPNAPPATENEPITTSEYTLVMRASDIVALKLDVYLITKQRL